MQKPFGLDSELRVYDIISGAIGLALFAWTVLQLVRLYKRYSMVKKAQSVITQRNSKNYDFDVSGIDQDKLIKMDVSQIRQAIITG